MLYKILDFLNPTKDFVDFEHFREHMSTFVVSGLLPASIKTQKEN